MGRGLPYNMGLMEPGCTHQDFGRDAQPAAPNRPRCRAEFRAKRLDDILGNAQKVGFEVSAWCLYCVGDYSSVFSLFLLEWGYVFCLVAFHFGLGDFAV